MMSGRKLEQIAKNKVGLIGRKIGMTQVFSEKGDLVPVTVIRAGPCRVIQKKARLHDGYDAVQLGFEELKKKRGATKPSTGQFRKIGLDPLGVLREIRGMTPDAFEVGQELRADVFRIGDLVSVEGRSKGRGFAGGVKRHGYRGGRASHGSMFHRAPGSIGAASYPSRVFKGKRLPGRMGNERNTVRNLSVMGVDAAQGIVLVKGAVPGPNRSLVVITADREQTGE